MKKLRISVEGKTYDVEVELLSEDNAVQEPRASVKRSTRVATPVATAKKAVVATNGTGDVVSPLAAVVVSIDVAIGDTVQAGDAVATLEAMKMNTIVTATTSGSVQSIHVAAGDALEEGQAMLSLN